MANNNTKDEEDFYDPEVNARALEMIRENADQKRQQVVQPWTEQKNAALNAYLNREDFKYDFNADALYHHYKDKYTRQGKMAMQDTMGQAAALTGGYGSSYAQSVGQQAYDAQLQNLNDVIPELYQMAYSRYQDQGNNLLQQYSLLAGEEADAYSRVYQEEQDAVADHQYNTNFGYQASRNQAADDAAATEAAILEKPVFSRVDKATGLYYYYYNGQEVKYEQGVNPVTGTANPDGIGRNPDGSYRVFLDLNGKPGYQPNNIGGVKIEKSGFTDTINGHEQNVWRKTDDGSYWMWDDTVNAYVKYTGDKKANREVNTKNVDKFKRSIMPKEAFDPTASDAAYKKYIQQQIEEADSYLTDDEVYTLMKYYGFI